MLILRIILSGCLFALACSLPAQAAEQGVFSINSKTVELSPKLLKSFRAKWKKEKSLVRMPGEVKGADVMWVRDYISIVESLYEEDCAPLSIVETRPFDSAKDQDETEVSKAPKAFDYVWTIRSKHGTRKYRVLREEGSGDLMVYPLTIGYEDHPKHSERVPNQPPQRNAGSRPSSGESPASETPSSLGPRG
jgi:hypothetical protein